MGDISLKGAERDRTRDNGLALPDSLGGRIRSVLGGEGS